MTLTLPDWDEFVHEIFSRANRERYGLNERSLKHYKTQYRKLEAEKDRMFVEPDSLTRVFEQFSRRIVGLDVRTEQEVVEEIKSSLRLPNQFMLTGLSTSMHFDWVDERVADILDLPSPEDFTLAGLCGLDPRYELFHPEDVLHTIRMGMATLLAVSVDGVRVDSFKDYYEIRFRMGFSARRPNVMVNRRCFISNSDLEEEGTRHVDHWTITHGQDRFKHVHARIVSHDPLMNEFVNGLAYITNARLCGFSLQDLILLDVHLNSSKAGVARFKLNEMLDRCGVDVFPAKKYTDAIHNLNCKLNRILKANIPASYPTTPWQGHAMAHRAGQMGVERIPAMVMRQLITYMKRLEGGIVG